jgi:hypothetical protein
MNETAGIKYKKDAGGNSRYLQIDLNIHGENQLLEDFLDILDIEAAKGEPTYPLSDVLIELERKYGTKLV